MHLASTNLTVDCVSHQEWTCQKGEGNRMELSWCIHKPAINLHCRDSIITWTRHVSALTLSGDNAKL